jgi:hypothetical protein
MLIMWILGNEKYIWKYILFFIPSVTLATIIVSSIYMYRVQPLNTCYIFTICTECLFIPSVCDYHTRYIIVD